MNIKNRLSIQFTLLVFGILLFFSFLVYYFSYSSQQSKFKEDLLVNAQNSAILLIDVVEVDSTLLIKIQKTTKSLEEKEIAIYDSSDKLIYNHQMHYLNDYKPSKNSENLNPVYFSIKEKDGIIYKHFSKGKVYQVFVLAYDNYKLENQHRLRIVLFWSILLSILFSISISYGFSKMAILPISKIVADIKEINLSKLSKRLDEGKGKDEIEQLSVNFNKMLADLELAFQSQDEFVSNASHELRTPLAVMIAESEYILSRDRNNLEYVQQMSRLIDNLRKLNTLLNSLLELAHLNSESSIVLSIVRIDELLFTAIQTIKHKYPGRKIIPKIECSDDEIDLLIKGNVGFLEIAFKNLIDNACKFSSGDVEVKISDSKEVLTCRIFDHGIGIPATEIENIFKPFKRANNVTFIGGFGIGLTIVKKILDLHEAEIKVKSIENESTCFEIIFKK